MNYMYSSSYPRDHAIPRDQLVSYTSARCLHKPSYQNYRRQVVLYNTYSSALVMHGARLEYGRRIF